jgi:hypothetical protein
MNGALSLIDSDRLREIEYFSNQAACEVANPNISWAIDEVHKATGYVLEATGMDVSTVNEMQTREFSEVLL